LLHLQDSQGSHLHGAIAEVGAALPAGVPDAAPLGPGRLAEVTRRLAAAAGLWRPHVRRDAAGPVRTRLLWTPSVEVWLVEWAPGQATRAHGHDGAATALSVVEGTLVEECLDATIWTTCRRTTFARASTATFGPGHVHVLANPGDGPAASVHASSPPRAPGRQPAPARPGAEELCGSS